MSRLGGFTGPLGFIGERRRFLKFLPTSAARVGYDEMNEARLGHASIKTTMDVYGHLLPGLGDKLDAALDSAHGETTAALSRPSRGPRVSGEHKLGSVQTRYLRFRWWAVLGSNQ